MSKIIGFGVGLLVCGLFVVIGLFFARESYQLTTTGTRAEGIIVDMERRRDSDGTSYAPIVEFVAENGETVTFTSNVSSSSRPTIGERVKVIYPANSPADAEIDSFFTLWFIPIMFIGIPALVLVIMLGSGLMILLAARKTAPTPLPANHVYDPASYDSLGFSNDNNVERR